MDRSEYMEQNWDIAREDGGGVTQSAFKYETSVKCSLLPGSLSELLRVTIEAMEMVEICSYMRLDLGASWCRPEAHGWKLCAQGALMVFRIGASPNESLSPDDFPECKDRMKAAELLTMGQVHAAYALLNGPFYDTRKLPDDVRITPHPSHEFWSDLKRLLKLLEALEK